MKKIITRLLALVLALVLMLALSACTEVDQVKYNLQQDADNFNISRQITVFNTRTDTVLFQMTGLMSLSNNADGELVVTCEVANGIYKQHYIYLSDDVTYVMEDVSGTYEDKFHYELNFLPEMFPGVTITHKD